jgi:hypothetical protein
MAFSWVISLDNSCPGQAYVVINLDNRGAKKTNIADAYSIPDEFMLTLWPSRNSYCKCGVKW